MMSTCCAAPLIPLPPLVATGKGVAPKQECTYCRKRYAVPPKTYAAGAAR
jgi:hypothetical protein